MIIVFIAELELQTEYILFQFIEKKFPDCNLNGKLNKSFRFIQTADRIVLNDFQIDFWSDQITNIVDAVFNHRWSFQRQSPCDYVDVLR